MEHQFSLPTNYGERLLAGLPAEVRPRLAGHDLQDMRGAQLAEEALLSTMNTGELEQLKGRIFEVAPLPPTATVLRQGDPDPYRELRVVPVAVGGYTGPSVAAVFPTREIITEFARLKGVDLTEVAVYVVTARRWNTLLAEAYPELVGAEYKEAPEIEKLFLEAIRRGASDIHLKVGDQPRFRIHGDLVAQEYKPLTGEWMRDNLPRTANQAVIDRIAAGKFDADQRWEVAERVFRLNYGKDQNGFTLAARLLPNKIPTMDELNLPRPLRATTEEVRGLVLVTGPTGSGKTTTLASLLNHIIHTKPRHLITLENPIEYVLKSGRSAVSQRALGEHFSSFPEALRQALRQDPDIILVGEIRDKETARTAFEAAETGHLVFATLHTHNAATTVERLVHMFEPEEQSNIRNQIGQTLKVIVSQTLVPAIRGGRVAAFEVLQNTPAISNLLSDSARVRQIPSTLEQNSKDGMQTLEQNLAYLVRVGTVSYESAYERAPDKERFKHHSGTKR